MYSSIPWSRCSTIRDTRTESRWYELPQTRWIRSYLGVPIQVNGQVVGILNLDSATPGFFKPVHGERLKVFADQAATAVKNAQLVSETRRQAERERLINQITNRIRGFDGYRRHRQNHGNGWNRADSETSRCLLRLGADADFMPIAHEFTQPGIEPLR
ncbi:MAG: GAF domain-containing protein [Anaerolineae bacterium]